MDWYFVLSDVLETFIILQLFIFGFRKRLNSLESQVPRNIQGIQWTVLIGSLLLVFLIHSLCSMEVIPVEFKQIVRPALLNGAIVLTFGRTFRVWSITFRAFAAAFLFVAALAYPHLV